jgi:exonuclease SbcD
MLVCLAADGRQVVLISGNHDSAERLAFGGSLMARSGVHVAPTYGGEITPVVLQDEWGEVRVWPIPFLKPVQVRRFLPEEQAAQIVSYADAMRAVVARLPLGEGTRNVALAHQFVIGAATCDSEERSVGGVDEMPPQVFEPFDYVALGHLHGPQSIGRETVRYAGSPLKYSFSEAAQKKSVTVVEMGAKGDVAVRTLPLHARRDMVRLSGPFDALMQRAAGSEDYFEVTLTDEQDVPNALARLRTVYPNLMALRYDNTRTRAEAEILGGETIEAKSPLTLFEELYAKQNGQPMSEEQRRYVATLVEEIWRDAE